MFLWASGGPFEIVGFRRSTMMECKICLISLDVGTKLFSFNDQDQTVVCNDMLGLDGLGYLLPLGSVR